MTAQLRRPPVSPAVLELLERSRATLEAACRTSDASERYLDAHLGALRAAAALVAARTTPSPRSRPRSVWQVLPTVVPELGEWAGFFAGTSARRGVLDRGGWLGAREADDLLRQAEMFLEIVQDLLGLPQTVPLPDSIPPVSARVPVTGPGRLVGRG
ncbi:MAG TPA: SAV_6107 family HEPN domain-containing protein [Intrasporangium sp.]|uniref:SAV_6107 family HEPN domain-containing protein n=1 Tax=Intrasporangium sp. TaxID=1925024 RepID=UPI002D7A2412|nr:SAV_6107 family HEPN domain-containing protein [Intrasporangium sp.]HET7399331.1 SAV_6107 family HEPN domain-containing protein [Intrasporangium sp.]